MHVEYLKFYGKYIIQRSEDEISFFSLQWCVASIEIYDLNLHAEFQLIGFKPLSLI